MKHPASCSESLSRSRTFGWDSEPPVSAKHPREVGRHIAPRGGSFSLGNPPRLLVGQVVRNVSRGTTVVLAGG